MLCVIVRKRRPLTCGTDTPKIRWKKGNTRGNSAGIVVATINLLSPSNIL